jgi:carbonic anhydrase
MQVTKILLIGQVVLAGAAAAVGLSGPSASERAKVEAKAAAEAKLAAAKKGGEGEGKANGEHGAERGRDKGSSEAHWAKPGHAADGHAPVGGHAGGHAKVEHAAAHAPGHAPAALAGDPKAIARLLLEGNARFASGQRGSFDVVSQREHAAGGQHPGVMVLGCADSRVPPELVFDRGVGELFVVRSAGNLAEPVAVGSLEYAAEHLHAKVLLVLGHERCGAVQAALTEEKMPTPNLEAVVGRILPGVKGLKAWAEGADLVHLAVEANVQRQAQEVLRTSPVLRRAVTAGEIGLLKAVYDLDSGQVRPLP